MTIAWFFIKAAASASAPSTPALQFSIPRYRGLDYTKSELDKSAIFHQQTIRDRLDALRPELVVLYKAENGRSGGYEGLTRGWNDSVPGIPQWSQHISRS